MTGYPLTEEHEAFLRALSRVVLYVPRTFQADLGRAEGFLTSEYFVLRHLEEAPGHRLRMGDLAAETSLSPGAVTRVVKILEGKGLAERRPNSVDGRSHDAVLTERGRRRLESVRPALEASVRRRVFDKLDGADLAAFTDAMNRITDGD